MAALRLRRAAWQQTNYSGEARILIPDGYIPIPEALRRIRDLIDDDDFSVQSGPPIDPKRIIRRAAIDALGKELSRGLVIWAYVMDGGTIRRIPTEDMEQLVQERWENWVESGRVQAVEEKEGRENWFESHEELWRVRGATEPASHRYHGCTPLIEEVVFELLWKRQGALQCEGAGVTVPRNSARHNAGMQRGKKASQKTSPVSPTGKRCS